MTKAFFLFCILLFPAVLNAKDYVYEGSWNTTRNIKLTGNMTCVIVSTGKERWQGVFTGVWQGSDFSYTVPFTGPAGDLRGTANIDGDEYSWAGKVDTAKFRGSFTGKYLGSFELLRKQ